MTEAVPMKSALNRLAMMCLLASFLSGCVSSRIEHTRLAATTIRSGESMVLLGRASYDDKQTEASFTDCVADVLDSGSNPVRLIPQQKFKDELYPWFEPRTAPSSAKELAALFEQPGVQKRIKAAKVRYLAWIDGDTVTVNQGGSMSCQVAATGGACIGFKYWEQDASYEASIWDLETMTTAGQISADATGTSRLIGAIVPIPLLARAENAACKGLGKQLREFISGG